jgi:hypothetical protein
MIDTDKYEGHSTEYTYEIVIVDDGKELIATYALLNDAPLLLEEVKRLREESDEREAYIKRLSEQLARATKWAYKQVLHNDSAMMDFDDYVWGEEE